MKLVTNSGAIFLLAVAAAAITPAAAALTHGSPAVSYTKRSMVIHGKPKLLLSGAIHYSRVRDPVRFFKIDDTAVIASTPTSLLTMHSSIISVRRCTSKLHADTWCNIDDVTPNLQYKVPPSDWDSVFKTAKEMGLNCIQTYVIWNLHEHKQGNISWTG